MSENDLGFIRFFRFLPEGLKWIFILRPWFKRRFTGFSSHWKSFSDERSYYEGYNWIGANSSIRNSSLGIFSYVEGGAVSRSIVGRFCSIGPGAIVGGISSHPLNFISTNPIFYSSSARCGVSYVSDSYDDVIESKETIIGNDVWIGARAIIFDGVKVGDGAVIAAGAVVVKDVEPYSVVGGVPARHIRFRFSKENIEVLLSEKWWSGEPECVSARAKTLARNIGRIDIMGSDELYSMLKASYEK